MAEANGLNGTSWMKWALCAMGAIIMLLSGLWVNGVARDVDLVRQDYNKLYAEFGTVRNEQLQRTGRLSALETRLEVAFPAMADRITVMEIRINKLEIAKQVK